MSLTQDRSDLTSYLSELHIYHPILGCRCTLDRHPNNGRLHNTRHSRIGFQQPCLRTNSGKSSGVTIRLIDPADALSDSDPLDMRVACFERHKHALHHVVACSPQGAYMHEIACGRPPPALASNPPEISQISSDYQVAVDDVTLSLVQMVVGQRIDGSSSSCTMKTVFQQAGERSGEALWL